MISKRTSPQTNNATTVLYGIAWSDDTLLAQLPSHNLELEQQDGIKRNFKFDWQTLAAINPRYKRFVESEIARLGEDHLSIRTQYRLMPISGAGFLLNELQRHLLRGTHGWQSGPGDDEGDEANNDGFYIAGMDVGGEEHPKPGETTQKRDSAVLTVGCVTFNEFDLPSRSSISIGGLACTILTSTQQQEISSRGGISVISQ